MFETKGENELIRLELRNESVRMNVDPPKSKNFVKSAYLEIEHNLLL